MELKELEELDVLQIKEWIRNRLGGTDPYFPLSGRDDDPPYFFIGWAYRQPTSEELRAKMEEAVSGLLNELAGIPIEATNTEYVSRLLMLLRDISRPATPERVEGLMEAIRWQEVALRHRFHALRELALQVLLEREEPCGREFWQDYLRDYPATAVSGMFQVGTDEGLDALQQVYKHNGLGTAKDILEAKLPWIASRDLNFKQKFDRARDRFPEELRQVVDEWYGLPPLAGKPRVLLVVEDEKPIIEDISLFYEKFHDGGWRVEGLHVPKGGILPEVVVRQAAQCQADVVVLDMRFGDDEWAGMKLIPPLCQDNRFRPVIVNTVHTDAERLTECWNLGAADFTTKHLTTPDPEHGGLPLWISHLAMRVDLATRNSIVSRDLDKRLGEVENQAVTVRSRMLSLGRNGALRRSEESLRGYVNLGFEDRQSGVDSDVSEEVH